ncbi:MAG: hypothetical protein WCS17_03470 [Prevotella sp.]
MGKGYVQKAIHEAFVKLDKQHIMWATAYDIQEALLACGHEMLDVDVIRDSLTYMEKIGWIEKATFDPPRKPRMYKWKGPIEPWFTGIIRR